MAGTKPTDIDQRPDENMKQPLELTVMMYHYVRDSGDSAEAGSNIPGLSVLDFTTQLDELSRQHTLVAWPDVRAALEENKSLPRSACLLTFDDGVCDHYLNVFRILRERNLSGLFFSMARTGSKGLTLPHKIHFLLAQLGVDDLPNTIWGKLDVTQQQKFTQAEQHYRQKYSAATPDRRINLLKAVLQRDLSPEVDSVLSNLFEEHVGSEMETAQRYYLSLEQIREMASNGMHFGGHSYSHPWFDWIDPDSLNSEISASAEWLCQIEPRPWAFAYPYGGLNPDAPKTFHAHRFVAAFTTQTQINHFDPYFIGRLDGEEIAQARQGDD